MKLYESELSKIADYILERARRENKIDEVQLYAPIDRCLRPDRMPDAPCGRDARCHNNGGRKDFPATTYISMTQKVS